jgi:hypothetical protein
VKLPPEDIESFNRHFSTLHAAAYRWDLWAVASIINGGCSDDGFIDFRSWLISRGRKFYEAALADPEAAAKGVEPEEAEFETFAYAAGEAYERVTGRRLPDSAYGGAAGTEPAGTRWREDDLPRLYPKLCKKFDMI